MIPYLDLGATYRELKSEIDSGCYILGPEVDAFEVEYRRSTMRKFAWAALYD
jgi:hypothetical protein